MVRERETDRESERDRQVGSGKHMPYGHVSMSGTRQVIGLREVMNQEKMKKIRSGNPVSFVFSMPRLNRSAVPCQWHSQVSYLDILFA